jgi:predicted Fe-Mo cluster-binding NifX family protein
MRKYRTIFLVPHIDRLLIHYEPEEKPEVVVAVPLQSDQDRICDHFGEAPLFYIGVVRKFDGRVLEESLPHNPYSQEAKGKGLKVAEWLLTKKIDHVYTLQNLADKSPGYVLSDAGVEISVVNDASLAELRSRWTENHP